MNIGFIGQGWIGKNYADDFEKRGYSVTRYALEAPHNINREKISTCDIVFIAVPTPTTPEGFDASRVRSVLPLIGSGKIAVIKSTLLPGTTTALQKEFPDIFVLHSPEFLVEATAAHDAAHPNRNIVGIPKDTPEFRVKAEAVLSVLPQAPYTSVLSSTDAEMIKYAGNCFLLTKVMFINVLYDLVVAMQGDWKAVREALVHDPRIGESHTNPVHQGGRGAGGDCFIKDFEAFRRMYAKEVGDEYGDALLFALRNKNVDLLMNSGKDLELLRSVYGEGVVGAAAA
jgi:UDPglucose 6-dehydrogenase